MESGHGVRASGASTHYSHDDEQLSVASDQETADGSLYIGSFAAVGPFNQTASTFAFDNEASASASFMPHPHQQYSELSRSLEVEESLPEEQRHDYVMDEQQRQPQQRQPQQRRRQWSEQPDAAVQRQCSRRSAKSLHDDEDGQEHAAIAAAAASVSSSFAEPGPLMHSSSGRYSGPGSVSSLPLSRQLSSASRQQHRSRVAPRASTGSLTAAARTSADSLAVRSSSESLLAASIARQPQVSEALLPPRPSSSSPAKRPSSSHRRSSRHNMGAEQLLLLQQPMPQHLNARKSSSGNAHGHSGNGHAAAAVFVGKGGKGSKRQQDTPQQQQQQREQQHRKQLDKHLVLSRKPAPQFEGDLSEWGKTALEDYYDDDDQSISSGHPTLSSGVSPRDTRPRVKPFDLEAARETLAYNAGMFSRAQVLRRGGAAPAALGIADDLPDRMAYQQLNILAGMAGKVQDAILHNKRIFEQRLLQQDRALLRKTLSGWRVVCYGSASKQTLLRRAAARILRGALTRAFFAWKDELHLVDKTLAMKRKVAATIARGLLKRCFLAWQRLAEERWWKNLLVMREREVALLEGKIRGYEKRPIQVLQRRRMRATLQAWFAAAAVCREKRLALAHAGHFWANQQLSKAWMSWVEHAETAARRHVLTQKVVARCKQLQLAAAWNSWQEVAAAKQARQATFAIAAKQWHQALEGRAWRAWQDAAAQGKARRQTAASWLQPAKAHALSGWLDYVAWKQHSRLVVGRALARLRHGMLAATFFAWLEELQKAKMEATLAKKQTTEDSLVKLQAENERLRRDNERFVRLIDSGEWGRGRVAELVAAGEVMRGERDALLKLIGSIRREFEAVAAAKGSQEDELRLLKEKMSVGGPARNRLLVKGGSSFNALVRAMKQDLIDNGTAANDPALLYEIDKLSMDRVQVYPDGELCVQAVASACAPPALARLAAKGRAPAAAAAIKARPDGYSSPTPSLRGRMAGSSCSPKPGRGSCCPSAAAAAGAGVQRRGPTISTNFAAESLHSTLSVEAGPGSPGGVAMQGPAAAMSTQRVLQVLSSLRSAQVDQLKAAVMGGAAAGPGGGGISSAAALAGAGVGSVVPRSSGGRRAGLQQGVLHDGVV